MWQYPLIHLLWLMASQLWLQALDFKPKITFTSPLALVLVLELVTRNSELQQSIVSFKR
jgi:hypothetical protein